MLLGFFWSHRHGVAVSPGFYHLIPGWLLDTIRWFQARACLSGVLSGHVFDPVQVISQGGGDYAAKRYPVSPDVQPDAINNILINIPYGNSR